MFFGIFQDHFSFHGRVKLMQRTTPYASKFDTKQKTQTEGEKQSGTPFRHTLKKLIQQALGDENILFAPIDDTVLLLVIPEKFRYNANESLQIAKEIKQSILPTLK